MRVAFLGSGSFAIPALETLVRLADRFPLTAVLTRPDRPAARGRKVLPTPVRRRARELEVDCDAPETVRDPAVLDRLRALEIDLAIVADYGEILRESFLSIPAIGAFNLHASLLPSWRGAAPVQRAILQGDAETGVTLFRIVRALDAGPVVAERKVTIRPEETAAELEARLAVEAATVLEEMLPRFENGTFRETPQDESRATYAPKLSKEDGRIDWALAPRRLVDFVRALDPWPRATTWLAREGKEGERVIVTRVREASRESAPGAASALPGTIVRVEKKRLLVACGEGGAVEILEIQPEGRPVMPIAAFLNGRALRVGDRFRNIDAPRPGGDRAVEP